MSNTQKFYKKTVSTEKKPCREGHNCPYLRLGKCHFFHPPEHLKLPPSQHDEKQLHAEIARLRAENQQLQSALESVKEFLQFQYIPHVDDCHPDVSVNEPFKAQNPSQARPPPSAGRAQRGQAPAKFPPSAGRAQRGPAPAKFSLPAGRAQRGQAPAGRPQPPPAGRARPGSVLWRVAELAKKV